MRFAWSMGTLVFVVSALAACSSAPAGEEDGDEGALEESAPAAAPAKKQHVFVTTGEGKRSESDPRLRYFESARDKKQVAMVICSRDDRTVDYSVMDTAAPMSSNTIVTGRYEVPSDVTCTKFVDGLARAVLGGKVALRVRVTTDTLPIVESLEAIDHRAASPCDRGTFLKPDGFCG